MIYKEDKCLTDKAFLYILKPNWVCLDVKEYILTELEQKSNFSNDYIFCLIAAFLSN